MRCSSAASHGAYHADRSFTVFLIAEHRGRQLRAQHVPADGRFLGVAVFSAVVSASSTFEHGLLINFAGTAVLVAIAAAGTLALRTTAQQSSPGK